METSLEAARNWSPSIGRVVLVWHRANTEAELDAFLASSVRWAECDARADRAGTARVSHEPLGGVGGAMELNGWLEVVRAAGRSAKIDLKEDGSVLDQALESVARLGWSDDELWFNAAVEIPGRDGFERISAAHPRARVSCPLDTLASYLLLTPQEAFAVVDALRAWGINWLSFGAEIPRLAELVAATRERGWPINIWDVPSVETFRTALTFVPEAITADLGSISPERARPG